MKQSLNNEDRKALIIYRFQRSYEAMEDAISLLNQGRLNACINRIYYSCFYAVIGALLKEGIITKSHDGAKRMFGLKFVMTGKIDKSIAYYFSQLYNARITGDYDEFVVFTQEEAEKLMQKAQILNQALKQLTLEEI